LDALLTVLNFLDSNLNAILPWVLLPTGIFFTIYLKFPQFRYFGHALSVVKGKYEKDTDEGDTSHFQALTTALSGTVGTGNIGGVAFAIFLGGPAALFWMWVTAFLGMTSKFVEVTLSHKYREKAADGTMAGGPMYYMKNKLNMKWLGTFFAVATVVSSFGTGNMPQINNIASAVESTFGIDTLVTGLVLAVLLALVIIGGIKRIAAVTEKIVPTMAGIYIIGALAVIFANIENLVPSFISIFEYIFSGTAVTGGFLGATFAYAFNKGVGRGLFSNEAGQGSAPIAHASAKADEPVSEGMVAILEPFIDTLIICTITGLVILSSGVWTEKFQNDFQSTDMVIVSGNYSESVHEQKMEISNYLNEHESSVTTYSGSIQVENGKAVSDGFTIINARSFAEDFTFSKDGNAVEGSIEVKDGSLVDGGITVSGKSLVHSVVLTTEAFKRGFFGDFGQYIISIGLLLFAFSTVISWSYYGDRAMTYLFGSGSVIYYRIVYIAGFILAAVMDTSLVWTLANIAIVVMTLPNLVGIFLLRKDMKDTVKTYVEDFNKEHPDEKKISA
jgi:AGCS family alanine or glycine:cation symporter